MTIILIFSFILLVITSISIILSNSIRRAVILSGVMSIIASFVYLLLAAPDVALAEAVIGCTLSTIVLLMAIRQLEVIQVVYVLEEIPSGKLQRAFFETYRKEKFDVHFTSNMESTKDNITRYVDTDYLIVEQQEEVIFMIKHNGALENSILKHLEDMTTKPIRKVWKAHDKV